MSTNTTQVCDRCHRALGSMLSKVVLILDVRAGEIQLCQDCMASLGFLLMKFIGHDSKTELERLIYRLKPSIVPRSDTCRICGVKEGALKASGSAGVLYHEFADPGLCTACRDVHDQKIGQSAEQCADQETTAGINGL